MGKASSSKKVARAASTGGGRTARGARPWGWYLSMGLVAVLGVAIIVVSRNDRQEVVSGARKAKPALGDHWHAAYGVYLCDKFAPPIPEPQPLPGLHTHGDEVIHIEPNRVAETGSNATLGNWAKANNLTLTSSRVKSPGTETFTNGGKCGAKPGFVTVEVDDKVVKGDPRRIRLKDGQRIVIAFVPRDTEIPDLPPTALANLQKNMGTGAQPPTSIPVPAPGAVPPGTPEGSTTVPGASTPPASDAPATSTPAPPAGGQPSTTVAR